MAMATVPDLETDVRFHWRTRQQVLWLAMNDSVREKQERKPAASYHAASFKTGAYELIPLPFIDEWLIKRQRRQIVAAILSSQGITFEPKVPRILAGGNRSLFGRMTSLFGGLFLKPLKKLFRSVFFWLSARSAARTAMTTYFFARFLHHPNLLGSAGDTHLTEDRAKQLVEVFKEVAGGIDLKALKDAAGRLRRIFRKSSRASTSEVTRTIEEAAPGFINDFDAMVDHRLVQLDS